MSSSRRAWSSNCMPDVNGLEDRGNLKGKVALVLGGTGLIGRQVCRALAAEGALVAIQHLEGSIGAETPDEGAGPRALEVLLDATEPGAGGKAVREATANLCRPRSWSTVTTRPLSRSPLLPRR